MMEPNNWEGLSENDSEAYLDHNDQLYGNIDVSKVGLTPDDAFTLNQLDNEVYNNNQHSQQNMDPPYRTDRVNQHSQYQGVQGGTRNGNQQKSSQNNPSHNNHHQPQSQPHQSQNMDPLDKLNDFSLDNYDFVLDDTNMNLDSSLQSFTPHSGHSNGSNHHVSPTKEESYHNSSSAFPPTSSLTNTPNMLPNGKRIINESNVVNSPILPSQNDKSFNKQHYYHKISKEKSKESIEHLPHSQHVRPDVVFTPLVSPHGTPLDKKNHSKPIQATFEPLTSPALNAQSTNNDSMSKRRSSSSVFSTVDENKPNTFKRRTPHGTPIIQSLDNSNGSTKSPAAFEKLPEASMTRSSTNSSNSTPMLPPQSFKKIDPESTNTSPQMMGFTMGKLAKQQGSTSRYQESPVLKSRKSSFGSTKSSDTSPNLLPESYQGNKEGKYEKTSTKKASHKLAEQGRRNRMNSAVQTLGSLIPQAYHDRVSIPSKATTVELASSYIKDLTKEIERLKRK